MVCELPRGSVQPASYRLSPLACYHPEILCAEIWGHARHAGCRQRPDLRFRASASTLLTSDFEIPNCRAMAEGLTPALKAALTAFSLPVVSVPASWTCGRP